MIVRKYISESYQKVDAYSGVNEIEDILIENDFLAVFDEEKFCGVLTPADLIKRPHKLVIDCITEKGRLNADDTVNQALVKLDENRTFVLPVFDNDNYIGIIEKGNIIKRLTGKIDELYNRALISQKVRTQFLNNLSHEIRTPLNGILGFLDIIASLDLEGKETEKAEYAGYLRESSNRFLFLMNDLVELSLVHAGETLKVNNGIVNFKKIVLEIKNWFRIKQLVVDKKLSLDYVNVNPSAILLTDEKKLRHIFYHLIDNAIKFSAENSVVTFGFKGTKGSQAIFFVSNTGSQVDEEKRLKIFEIFEKDELAPGQYAEGLGIGLAVVRNLVEVLGGFIEVINEPNNKTTFHFSILAKEHQAI